MMFTTSTRNCDCTTGTTCFCSHQSTCGASTYMSSWKREREEMARLVARSLARTASLAVLRERAKQPVKVPAEYRISAGNVTRVARSSPPPHYSYYQGSF